MQSSEDIPTWDLSPAIGLLKTLSSLRPKGITSPPPSLWELSRPPDPPLVMSQANDEDLSLGNFGRIWEYLALSRDKGSEARRNCLVDEAESVAKEVRCPEEISGAYPENDADNEQYVIAASARTRKRAERRARARQRAEKAAVRQIICYGTVSDSASTSNGSDEDLDHVHRSLDRRAVIQDIVHRPSKQCADLPSPPNTPSPTKKSLRVLKRDWPISNPFQWSAVIDHVGTHQSQFLPMDNLSREQRTSKLITRLTNFFPSEAKHLKNDGLIHPEFAPLNTSGSGVHVFVDISNIMIGFHDCLKLSRDMPISTRIKRVPMSFHSFSLVLERGRPAAKRVLVGSDKFPTIQQAKRMGYETNILERVQKVKELTPRQRKFRNAGGTPGLSSGSETNTANRPEKWVEQAVDEIIHLKILESLVDADVPSTIVLATGDAAEAEYSGGFMRMVERALEKGWKVELVSFKLNTSGAYKRKDFRSKWGGMFKWVQLDDFVEDLIDGEDS